MKIAKTKTLVGALALLSSSAGMAATVTMTTPNLNPGTAVFLVTLHGSDFTEDPDQFTVGATLGISYSANLTLVGALVNCPSSPNCTTGTVTSGAGIGSGLPASGPFSNGSGGSYTPHFTPVDPTPTNPPPGGSLLTTFDILSSSGAIGDFDVLVFAFQSSNTSPGTITLIDNQGALLWTQGNDPFEAIPVTYGNGGPEGKTLTVNAIPLPATAWLIAPALLAAGRFSRRRKAA